jgi:hypothetical protein
MIRAILGVAVRVSVFETPHFLLGSRESFSQYSETATDSRTRAKGIAGKDIAQAKRRLKWVAPVLTPWFRLYRITPWC